MRVLLAQRCSFGQRSAAQLGDRRIPTAFTGRANARTGWRRIRERLSIDPVNANARHEAGHDEVYYACDPLQA
jgi:hypothetical protein